METISNMAAAHNMFIQGFNAIIYHAPTVPGDKVESFMLFCITLVRRASYSFGCPYVLRNSFLAPGIEALHEWCEKVQKGEVVLQC